MKVDVPLTKQKKRNLLDVPLERIHKCCKNQNLLKFKLPLIKYWSYMILHISLLKDNNKNNSLLLLRLGRVSEVF